jgi:hypothetical protein
MQPCSRISQGPCLCAPRVNGIAMPHKRAPWLQHLSWYVRHMSSRGRWHSPSTWLHHPRPIQPLGSRAPWALLEHPVQHNILPPTSWERASTASSAAVSSSNVPLNLSSNGVLRSSHTARRGGASGRVPLFCPLGLGWLSDGDTRPASIPRAEVVYPA